MMMMEVTHALVAIDNDFVTAYWCLVEHSEDAPTQTTHYFDHQAHNWIQGPDADASKNRSCCWSCH